LVRGDEVDRNIASNRIHHTEVEERVGAGRRLAERGAFNVGDLETSHLSLPCFRARPLSCRSPVNRDRMSAGFARASCSCASGVADAGNAMPSPPAERGEYQAKI